MGNGCPKCSTSKGEKAVEYFLIENKIVYKQEFSFPDLKGKYEVLRFDFAIFGNDVLKCLIEFDGLQYFKYVKGFHKSEEDFYTIQKYDKLKNIYCKKNKINLIRIQFNEDINVKLAQLNGKI
jgi:hypothetical protein